MARHIIPLCCPGPPTGPSSAPPTCVGAWLQRQKSNSGGWVMLTSTVVPAGMLPLANLVLWWWEGRRRGSGEHHHIDYSHHITFFMRTAIGQDRRMYVVFGTRDPVWCRPHAPDAARTAAPGGGGGGGGRTTPYSIHTAYTQYPSPLSDTPEDNVSTLSAPPLDLWLHNRNTTQKRTRQDNVASYMSYVADLYYVY